jgi:uncharacterized radical SAM superfamily Fe-S cluster-containing enzyme
MKLNPAWVLNCNLWSALRIDNREGTNMAAEGMSTAVTTLGVTESVCPQCLRRIAAERIAEGDDVFLRKSCPEHGPFRTILWRGLASYQAWAENRIVPSRPPSCAVATPRGCPFDCGLCSEHRQHTCCVVLEVTQRCNLNCPVCFAGANSDAGSDPSLDEIQNWCQTLLSNGGPYNIQLSGGEPALRDDLPEIVELVRARGFSFVQLNTNGIRLARDRNFVKRLKDAGLGCVFLQFDGVSEAVHRRIRGRDLRQVKEAAIRNCAAHELGVVLVPTLVPNVNTAQIGDMIRFAIAQAPTIRAIHFQPISYFGRYPSPPRDCDRITLPEVMQKIEEQTAGLFRAKDFYPASGENAFCEFHGKFWLRSGGRVEPAARPASACCAPPIDESLVQLGATPNGNGEGARRARKFVAQHWSLPPREPASNSERGIDVSSLDAFLAEARHSFCISGMAFQDAWNLDLTRLRECFLHVLSPDRKMVPLCAYNLTGIEGRTLYRTSCHAQPETGGVA